MTILSKATSTLSIGSALYDIHKTAQKYSREEMAKVSANRVISNSLGAQKSDTFSWKDAARKNWLSSKNFFATPYELLGKISGYFKGVAKTAPRYFPNFVLGIIGMGTKNKTLAKLSTLGLVFVEAYDFIVNSTNIGQRTDRLKIK